MGDNTIIPEGFVKVDKGKAYIPAGFKKIYNAGPEIEHENILLSTAKAAGRVLGATLGSIASFGPAGLEGIRTLLPETKVKEFETDEEYKEFHSALMRGENTDKYMESREGGTLREATEHIETMMSAPSELFIKTPEEMKSMEYIALADKPIQYSGEGWRLIAEASEKAYFKIQGEDHRPTVAQPIAATIGEIAALGIFSLEGVKAVRSKGRVMIEGMTPEKFSEFAKKTEEKVKVHDEMIPEPGNEASRLDVGDPASEYIGAKFSEKFLQENDVRPQNLPDSKGMVELTPEESFLNSIEGVKGLKESQDIRAALSTEFINDVRSFKPTAKFIKSDVKLDPNKSVPMFEIIGGPEHGSTVYGTDALLKRGIPIPKEGTLGKDLAAWERTAETKKLAEKDTRTIEERTERQPVTEKTRDNVIDLKPKIEEAAIKKFEDEVPDLVDQKAQELPYKKGDTVVNPDTNQIYKIEGVETRPTNELGQSLPPEPHYRLKPINDEAKESVKTSGSYESISVVDEYYKPLKDTIKSVPVIDKAARLQKLKERAAARKKVREVEVKEETPIDETRLLSDEELQRFEDDLWLKDDELRREWKKTEEIEGELRPEDDMSFEPYNDTTLYGGLPLIEFAKQYTKHIGQPIWDMLIMNKLPNILEAIPKLSRGFKKLKESPPVKLAKKIMDYDYRGDLPDTPEYMDSLNSMRRTQNIGREYALDLGNRLQSFDESSQLKMGDRLRGADVKLTPNEGRIAKEAREALDNLGRQAVDVGLLSEEVFFKNVGRYLPRLYTASEYGNLRARWGMPKPNRMELSRFKKRKDIPKELRQELGEILKPGYPVAKAIVQLTHDIEMSRFFNTIAKNPDWAVTKQLKLNKKGKPIPYKVTTYDPLTGKPIQHFGYKKGFDRAIPEGWEKLPKDKKLGELSDSYVHPEIAADLNEIVRVRSKGEKIWRTTLGAWKFGKVILSPKTHARNLFSNSILSHLGGMPLYRQPSLLIKAAKQMVQKGDLWKMAKDEGLLDSTFSQHELKGLFDNIDGQLKGVSPSSLPGALAKISQAWQIAKKGANKAADLYQAEEQWFKMAKFIDNHNRKKMSPKEAAKDAEKWLFNYGKLTRAQEAYRSKWYGAPFATFTIKAVPRIIEAGIKTPWRFALPGFMIYQLENAARAKFMDSKEETAAKEDLRPEWMQGSFAGIPNFPRVPITDETNREYWLNISYMMPWGTISESGGVFGLPGGIVPGTMPFVKEGWQQLWGSSGFGEAGGYDSFWKEPIVKESDVAGLEPYEKWKVAAQKRGRHLYNNAVPTIAVDIEKAIQSLQKKPDWRGRVRPPGVVAADVIGGLKMYPVDYAEQMMRNVGELDPNSGFIARKIMSEIQVLSLKRNYFEQYDNQKQVKKYDEQIAKKVKQLRGLGKELSEKGDTYKIIEEENK